MKIQKTDQYHKELFSHFGFNFGFVADLLDKYFEDRNSVTDYWREYFDQLTSGGKSDNKNLNSRPQQGINRTISISESFDISPSDELQLITGVGAKIIQNMNDSLGIPTATSLRTISVKLLEENRIIINQFFKKIGLSKISFTHIVSYAIVQGAKKFKGMNNSFAFVDGKPNLVKKPYVNIGLAVDTVRKDGTRSLIVPNIKNAEKMNFKEFINAYNVIIEKSRTGKLEPIDFQGSTITLTNPGGIGTVSSTPRLMSGQGCIIAIGAIDYPSEFKALHATALASLGIGKIMTITSTYDHRIIQGAESGEFLSYIDKLLLGEENFYENIFADLDLPQKAVGWGVDTSSKGFGQLPDNEHIKKQALLLQLINMFRVRGHLLADINPLGQKFAYNKELDPAFYGFTIWDYDRSFITANLQGMESGTLREIMDVLHKTYCEKIGVEYMHIQNQEEKQWLQEKMEPVFNKPSFDAERKKRIMEKLVVAESFEHFLHTKFVGHKRFSLEGNETIIPVLDHLLSLASDKNVEEILLGMAHRGRLNILSNIIGKSYERIFSEFEEDIDPDSPQGTGDVKYHLGASGIYKTISGKVIKVSVASNPSHLEFVNPVVEGITRAKQTRNNDLERNKFIPVLLHGDAAFAGQGVVAETLNLSQLKGYRTGGTIHVIINNQIGFTTNPEDARSSPYATDVAKMIQAPIFHINGDDPEAALWGIQLAFEYRMHFHKDIVVDIIGYRRHGHNEGDDPVYTQPLMYKKIKNHPSVKEIYENKMAVQNVMSRDEITNLEKSKYEQLENSLKNTKNKDLKFKPNRPLAYPEEFYESSKSKSSADNSFESLSKIVEGITNFDSKFTLNSKLQKQILKRKEFLTGNTLVDWAFAEALAFGSILLEGRPVRLSGQDSARGTFSQRHLILTDMNTEEEIIPLNLISHDQAKIEALDSLLSEAAVLGFEFGYSVADPLALVIWEAQFGDFANGAQVIIDNFIVASQTKWQQPNNVVLLLPHGQEGQGPEHSSARLERFLILCAENNMYVCNPTTPAQYFHLLKRQIHNSIEKPMVIMTPKSLLRLPAARSPIEDFTKGKFLEVIDDNIIEKSGVKRIVLTSGKIYYELIHHKETNNINHTAVVRVEQYYPFPDKILRDIISSYSNAVEIFWVQEEPQNMGAWNFIFPKLLALINKNQQLKFIGRVESPSPASGSVKLHIISQEEIIKSAFN
jgi:2-oxoglutarate dehydrogenase E1 component